jgi:dipeptidyl-peptidase-4
MSTDSISGTLSEVPRQLARTQRFSLGVPRQVTVAEDGDRVIFVRTKTGEDRTACLWAIDGPGERLLVDPTSLESEDEVPEAERARRERVRERARGIVTYSADRSASKIVFALGGGLWMASPDGQVGRLNGADSPVDPRIDRTGERVAYVSNGSLHVHELDDGTDRVIAAPEAPEVTYGLPEHVAAEEMHRVRGHWWSPDGTRLLVARVDNSPVNRWWISDPTAPSAPPREIFYPLAGKQNADVSLFVFDQDGSRTEVKWDRDAFEYLATADWDRHGPIISVQSRDQRTLRTLAVDQATGKTALIFEATDAQFVRLVPGSPTRTESGRLVIVADRDGARRLLVDAEAVTDDDVQVREVLHVEEETVWFVASTEPTEEHVWSWSPGEGAAPITHDPGIHNASVGGRTVVLQSFTERGKTCSVDGPMFRGTTIAVLEATPILDPMVRWLSIGPRALRTALVLPSWYEPGARKLPVLLSPYGGPAAQRVTRARHWHFIEAQWFADNGFAVLMADGAGTPGRGPRWEREIYGDVLSPVIADQITALQGAAEQCSDLDLSRVAIRGWSYGGLLALACVLRHPDVFHAAVAGAAPTDMRLYDTHYRERYLGHPDEHPENYARCSPLYEAASLTRPLLMIHGIADDNVVVANTLRMSAALLTAGRPHEVLLLPSATHMATDPDISLSIDLYELRFLERSLGLASETAR